MNKGLEALENIKENCDLFDEGYQWDKEFSKQFDENLDIIEQELKDLDTIKEIFSQYELEYKLTSVREALLLLKQYQGSYGVRGQALITKKLKALEIIKKYLATNSITQGLLRYGANKEEIELVKEVFNYGK